MDKPSDAPAVDALDAQTYVLHEDGRWVVYLDVAMPSEEHEMHIVRHRIGDHSTERRAEVAAHWIRRTAVKDLPAAWSGKE